MINANNRIHSFPPTGAYHGNYNGLTKREYFAGLALQGLLTIFDDGNGLVPNEQNSEYMAKMAVLSADALLKALEKPE